MHVVTDAMSNASAAGDKILCKEFINLRTVPVLVVSNVKTIGDCVIHDTQTILKRKRQVH